MVVTRFGVKLKKRNFIKILVLDPKRAKLVQISLRKVDGKLTLFPRPVQEDPYGPIYGPIRAHMGPNPDRAPTRTGPQPGPDLSRMCLAKTNPVKKSVRKKTYGLPDYLSYTLA